ncbi:MAG: FAD-dependent oxidoreductase [Armatimonadota bacterium]|nr:FAD-dependent oxidoreductase [Armatimonadota bacterium]
MCSGCFDYVIIGNSTAAVGAVEAIRSIDKLRSIAVVSAEAEHTYSRPLITYYLAGKVHEENVYYRPKDFYEKMDVACHLGVEVDLVVCDAREVRLTGGGKLGYGKLLIAAGGAPIAPAIPGIDRPGVFFMNTLEDARRAKGWLSHTRRSVVIGAGLTGMKTAEALVQMGKQVTVVEMADRVLPTVLDSRAANIVKKWFSSRGVDVLTGVMVVELEGREDSNDVWRAVLSSGESIACDSVFVTVGVRPRIELVRNSPIRTDKGILVDRTMRTSVGDVYAAGDIAQAYEPITGEQRVVPILPNAYIGGRIAGINMAGGNARYNVGMSANSTAFFGLSVMSAGLANVEDGSDFHIITRDSGLAYRKLVFRDGRLVGMIAVADVEGVGLLTGIMRDGIDVHGLEAKLLDGTIRLIDLPADIRAARLEGKSLKWT